MRGAAGRFLPGYTLRSASLVLVSPLLAIPELLIQMLVFHLDAIEIM